MRRFMAALLKCGIGGLLVPLTAVVRGAEAPPTPVHYTASDSIVVLGAVPQEITVFTDAMGHPPKSELWGIPYYRGTISGKKVVVAITGIGKTFTGMTTTLFITEFKPRLVLRSGGVVRRFHGGSAGSDLTAGPRAATSQRSAGTRPPS